MEKLTKKEEEIMYIIWKLKKVLVHDIIEQLTEEPKPPYSTVSSVVRILEKKGFVMHKAYGKTHEYYPAISKAKYLKGSFKSLIDRYFEGSYKQMVSFLVEQDNLNDEEAAEIQQLIDEKLKKK